MKQSKKDFIGFIMIIINSIILFILSNSYMLRIGYEIKIPIILCIICFLLLNIYPSLLTKKLYDNNLKRIKTWAVPFRM